jgi:hypothetical protein
LEKLGAIQPVSDIQEISAEVFGHFRTPYRESIDARLQPRICATVTGSYPAKHTSAGELTCYRVDLRVTNAQTAYVDYELHPEFGMVRKRSASSDNFHTWVLAYDDFWVRIRTRGGVEAACWLADAIEGSGALTQLEKEAVKNLRRVRSLLACGAVPSPNAWDGNSRWKIAELADELNRPYRSSLEGDAEGG